MNGTMHTVVLVNSAFAIAEVVIVARYADQFPWRGDYVHPSTVEDVLVYYEPDFGREAVEERRLVLGNRALFGVSRPGRLEE